MQCPSCGGSNAFILATTIECENSRCIHYLAPPVSSEFRHYLKLAVQMIETQETAETLRRGVLERVTITQSDKGIRLVKGADWQDVICVLMDFETWNRLHILGIKRELICSSDRCPGYGTTWDNIKIALELLQEETS